MQTLSKESFQKLIDSVDSQTLNIVGRAARQAFNVEESAKNGSSETIIGMIIELESTLRVLKRRLICSLPAEIQSKYSPV